MLNAAQSPLYRDLERILLTREQIRRRIDEIGEALTRDFQGKDLVCVCILKGAAPFFSDMIRAIDLPLRVDFMSISSYGSATKSSGVVRILKDLDRDIVGAACADYRGHRRLGPDPVFPQAEPAGPRRRIAFGVHPAGQARPPQGCPDARLLRL